MHTVDAQVGSFSFGFGAGFCSAMVRVGQFDMAKVAIYAATANTAEIMTVFRQIRCGREATKLTVHAFN